EDKKPEKKIKGKSVPNRDTDTAKKALSRANYLCEYDSSHKLFIRKKQNINYTEPHHLIPLKYDDLFEKSLDVQANIVSLCSHCHNLIHYGADAEVLIRKLWSERYQEIQDAGIGVMENGTELTLDILLGFYGIK
ncbi:HNH endonuclease, partial [Eubacterium ventriosum]|uniref:HNH endonuclease n=1 Tax=Eubacterium ventriosum TaxID=39496 RepID=UPI003AB45A39